MIPLALLLQAATTPASSSDTDRATVVVTGRRLDAAQARLAACLARHCPPKEDIAAATALAVAQFLAGEYENARDTAGRAVSRNHRYTPQLSVEMSDLLALHGALASLTGVPEVGKARAFDAVSALRRGPAPDGERIGLAQLAVADEFSRQGMVDDAVSMYDAIARRAAAAGEPAIRGRAMLQAAMLYAAAARFDPVFAISARKRIAAINATTDPALQSYRNATVALRGQIASLEGNDRELAKVLAEAQAIRSREPMLVYNPRLDLSEASTGTAQDPVTFDTRDQWLTIAFRIAPDGTVHDVTTREAGRHASGPWVADVLRSMAKRRYLPLDLPADSAGIVKVERASLVSNQVASTRSRIATHGGPQRVQFTDLTPRPGTGEPGSPSASAQGSTRGR